MKKEQEKYHFVGMLDSEVERDVFLEIKLEPGNYIVLPRSEGVCLNFARNEKP